MSNEYKEQVLAAKVSLVYMGENITLTIRELIAEVNCERSSKWKDYTIEHFIKYGFIELFKWLYYYEFQRGTIEKISMVGGYKG